MLASHGLKVTSESAGTVPSDTSESLVLYRPGETAQALDVMKYLSGAVMMQANASTAVGKVEVRPGIERRRGTGSGQAKADYSILGNGHHRGRHRDVGDDRGQLHQRSCHAHHSCGCDHHYGANARRLPTERVGRPAGALGPAVLLSERCAPAIERIRSQGPEGQPRHRYLGKNPRRQE